MNYNERIEQSIEFNIIHNKLVEHKSSSKIKSLDTTDEKALFNDIISTDIGLNINFNHYSLFKNLSPILNNMLMNHKKCSYVMHKENITNFKKNDSIIIAVSDLINYFRNIIYKVLPQSLLGNNNNKKRFIKGVGYYLRMAKDEKFYLHKLANQMNIAAISWLKHIKNTVIQRFILIMCIKWLFKSFIDAIITNNFYVTIISKGNKKSFIRHSDWKNLKQKCFKTLKIVRVNYANENNKQKLIFRIKQSGGIRSVIKSRRSVGKRSNNKIINSLLKQLQLSKFNGIVASDYNNMWLNVMNIREQLDKGNKNNMFLLKFDIKNAFSTVKQNLLFDIIKELFKDLPKYLHYRSHYKRIKINSTSYNRAKIWFIEDTLKLPEQYEICERITKTKRIKRDAILYEIENYIKQNLFRYEDSYYTLNEGLSQGGGLSSILCEIYHLHMIKKYMSHLLDTCVMHKTSDDFLIVTFEKSTAEEFLKIVYHGISEYKCQFKHNKFQMNFNANTFEINNDFRINYLNTIIEGKKLQTRPAYPMEPRYCTTLKKQITSNYILFNRRLLNVNVLRVHSMHINRYNSQKTTLKIVKEMAIFQAKRCLTLMNLFPVLDGNISEIKNSITLSNNIILSIILKLRKPYYTSSFVKTVKYYLWNSYKFIFNRSNDLSLHHSTLFKLFFDKNLSILKKESLVKLCDEALDF